MVDEGAAGTVGHQGVQPGRGAAPTPREHAGKGGGVEAGGGEGVEVVGFGGGGGRSARRGRWWRLFCHHCPRHPATHPTPPPATRRPRGRRRNQLTVRRLWQGAPPPPHSDAGRPTRPAPARHRAGAGWPPGRRARRRRRWWAEGERRGCVCLGCGGVCVAPFFLPTPHTHTHTWSVSIVGGRTPPGTRVRVACVCFSHAARRIGFRKKRWDADTHTRCTGGRERAGLRTHTQPGACCVLHGLRPLRKKRDWGCAAKKKSNVGFTRRTACPFVAALFFAQCRPPPSFPP